MFVCDIIITQVSNYNSITFSIIDSCMNPPNDLLDTNFIYIMHEKENQVFVFVFFFQVLTDEFFDRTVHNISRLQFLVSSPWLS